MAHDGASPLAGQAHNRDATKHAVGMAFAFQLPPVTIAPPLSCCKLPSKMSVGEPASSWNSSLGVARGKVGSLLGASCGPCGPMLELEPEPGQLRLQVLPSRLLLGLMGVGR